MSEPTIHVLAVIGSLHRESVTRTVIQARFKPPGCAGCSVDILDFEQEPLALYNPDTAHAGPGYSALRSRVEKADVMWLLNPFAHFLHS